MERGRRDGGILQLLELFSDPDVARAIEADLIRDGLRLRWLGDGTGRLSWHDLYVLVMHPTSDSAMLRQMGIWSPIMHRLANVEDAIRIVSWQLSGSKQKPQLVERPGMQSADEGDPFNDDESGTFTGEAIPIDELNEFLGWT